MPKTGDYDVFLVTKLDCDNDPVQEIKSKLGVFRKYFKLPFNPARRVELYVSQAEDKLVIEALAISKASDERVGLDWTLEFDDAGRRKIHVTEEGTHEITLEGQIYVFKDRD